MSAFRRKSPSTQRLSESPKYDPLIEISKHIRTPRDFKTRNGISPLFLLRKYNSKSPTNKLADLYLSEIDHLCDNTKKNLGQTRSKLVSLTIKVSKPKICFDEYSDCKTDVINQCRDFVFNRKYSLKTQQQMLTDKKLERKVTKRMFGEY